MSAPANGHQLFLLRHAKSDWDDPTMDDHDRPLAPRGRRAGSVVMTYLAGEQIRPHLVLCSTACRARQTLDLVLPALGTPPVRFERSLYTFSGQGLLESLRDYAGDSPSVMVIGHNPAIEEVALHLCADTNGHWGNKSADERARIDALASKFPTAAFAHLELYQPWATLGTVDDNNLHLPATLHRFTRPKDLRA